MKHVYRLFSIALFFTMVSICSARNLTLQQTLIYGTICGMLSVMLFVESNNVS